MLEHSKKNDELVLQYRNLMEKANKETDVKQKERYLNLAKEKHREILIQEFEDKNFERFSGKI